MGIYDVKMDASSFIKEMVSIFTVPKIHFVGQRVCIWYDKCDYKHNENEEMFETYYQGIKKRSLYEIET